MPQPRSLTLKKPPLLPEQACTPTRTWGPSAIPDELISAVSFKQIDLGPVALLASIAQLMIATAKLSLSQTILVKTP